MANSDYFPIERLAEIKRDPYQFRLLQRVPDFCKKEKFPFDFAERCEDERPIVFLDVETTGLSAQADRIIELGLVKILYSPSRCKITSIVDSRSYFQDPNIPIPEFISSLTGITDEMVAGQVINDEVVGDWFNDDPIVIAHNAKFDRPFFEKRFSSLRHLEWGCSAFDIDWRANGFESAKLEFLLFKAGWFYDGHRAEEDCLALAWLFHCRPFVFEELLAQIHKKTIVVQAFGAPFDVKDHLKARGYRWHSGDVGASKHWWREVAEEQLPEERQFLDRLYDDGSQHAHYLFRDARTRFKA